MRKTACPRITFRVSSAVIFGNIKFLFPTLEFSVNSLPRHCCRMGPSSCQRLPLGSEREISIRPGIVDAVRQYDEASVAYLNDYSLGSVQVATTLSIRRIIPPVNTVCIAKQTSWSITNGRNASCTTRRAKPPQGTTSAKERNASFEEATIISCNGDDLHASKDKRQEDIKIIPEAEQSSKSFGASLAKPLIFSNTDPHEWTKKTSYGFNYMREGFFVKKFKSEHKKMYENERAILKRLCGVGTRKACP